MNHRALTLALTAALATASVANADEVLFKNGDRLTGTVKSVEGGKMTIDTKLAGEVKVDLKEVKTFTTDAPIDLRTKEGERITSKATGAGEGSVELKPDAANARAVPLEDVKYVNFNESWTGSVVAGAQFARGNTNADQANLSFDLTRRTEIDRWMFTGGYNFGRERDPGTGDKVTTVDNWYATGKYDYFLNEKFYVFGSGRYEHDRIAELDYRLIPGVGVGYLWFDTADLKFDTEAGLAYVYEKYNNGEKDENISARLAYHLKKNLGSDKLNFFHDLEFYPSLRDGRDFLGIADAGLRAAITKQFFAEYKLEYRYDSTPASGQDKTDLRHIVGVGWKF